MGLPGDVGEEAFAAEAERRGLRVHTLASSRIERGEPRGLVLGYANASERELREAAGILAEVLAAVRG
jgi:DNA-binding transcriptional MocR family regulator